MLDLDADVHTLFRWFDATHSVTERGWQRTALPHAGGLGDQDSRLMSALEYLQQVRNEIARVG